MPTDKGEMEVIGRVNGIGDPDPHGSYARFYIDGYGSVTVSEQQAIDIAVNISRAWPEVHREAQQTAQAEENEACALVLQPMIEERLGEGDTITANHLGAATQRIRQRAKSKGGESDG